MYMKKVVSSPGQSQPQSAPRTWGGVRGDAEVTGVPQTWSESDERALCVPGARESLTSFQVIEG